MYNSRIQEILKQPIETFVLIGLIVTSVGMLIDLVTFSDSNSLEFLGLKITINLSSIFFNLLSLLIFLQRKSSLRLVSGVLIYNTLLNVALTDIYLFVFDVPIWQYIIFRDAFVIAAFATASLLVYNQFHVFLINVFYISYVLAIVIVSEDSFFARHALFIILMMACFSLGVGIFMKKLKQSINHNHQLLEITLQQSQELLKKDNELIAEKALSLEYEIQQKNKEFLSRAMGVIQLSEEKNKIIQKLLIIKDKVNYDAKNQLTTIIKEISSSCDQTHWDEFQMRFEDVHQDFYDSININFPKLSPAEIKLAAFIKLGLSSKEIAQLNKNTKESVDVARSRLRKKMNIDKSKNFVTFLSQY